MPSRRSAVRVTPVYLMLIVLGTAFVAPLLWLFDTALKSFDELGSYPVHWVPAVPRWDNFSQALTYFDFLGYTRNSLTISIIYATLATLSSAAAGFGLARLDARGRPVVFALMLSTLMLPQIITLIPTYLIFAKVGLVGTYWPWVLWGAGGSAFLAFLFRQFFAGLPRELDDAALIDGCGYGRIFLRIFLPLARPALATSFVLAFVFTWGDWIGPTLLLNQDQSTLAVAVSSLYVNQNQQPLNHLVAAGALLYTLPVLIVFVGMQRAFVRGAATSGIK